jgi:hypothetical protein
MALSLVLQINYIELKCFNCCCLLTLSPIFLKSLVSPTLILLYSLRVLATIFLEICMKMQFLLLFQYNFYFYFLIFVYK